MNRWILSFLGGSAALMLIASAVFWYFDGFGEGQLSTPGVVAVVLGSILTSALGVGLMALTFYSDRSGRDDSAGGPS